MAPVVFINYVIESTDQGKLLKGIGNKPLEPVCCKEWKKSPNQETGLGNRGPLEALNDTKLILND